MPQERAPSKQASLLCLFAAQLLSEGALFMSMALSRFDEADEALDMATQLHKIRLGFDSMDKPVDESLAQTLLTRGKVARCSHMHLSSTSAMNYLFAQMTCNTIFSMHTPLHVVTPAFRPWFAGIGACCTKLQSICNKRWAFAEDSLLRLSSICGAWLPYCMNWAFFN